MKFCDYESELEYRQQAFLQTELLSTIVEMLVETLKVRSRVFGAWNGSRWMINVEGRIQTQPTYRLMAANLLAWHMPPDVVVREIGPDGLPVEEVAP